MEEQLIREIADSLEHTAATKHWQRIGVRPRKGVCVPLFSLRSERDCGVGDVADLELLIDWCVRGGLDVIQLLPINDMGMDSVPYSALSAFAIDPLYLALDRVDAIRDDPELKVRAQAAGKRLNEAETIPYQEVRREKMALLNEAFRRSYNPELRRALDRFEETNPWLADYLPYRVLKEEHDYRSWEDWGMRYRERSSVDEFLKEHDGRRTFHLYLQWLAFYQFRAAREYAESKGVLIKGDIPILVNRDSADVWRHPEYFYLDTVAGAPPDMYAEDGQVWGFPTYNWEALAHTNYGWWRERLAYAQNFFDLYRIDHVVGFFRIWTVRHGAENGREGWFVPGDESQWGDHGRRLLSMMLDASHMLPLAEDLGTIPHICRSTLREMGICGLKVQRWEKRWEQDSSIIPPREYHPYSVATVSTHDSETLAHWWQAFPEERQPLWSAMGREGGAPEQLAGDDLLAVLRWVRDSGSLFVIFMLQELLQPFGLLPGDPADHRINVPGTVGDHNWTWRAPVTLESLLADESHQSAINSLLK